MSVYLSEERETCQKEI